MQRSEHALARSKAYSLFGRLYLRGLRAEDLPVVLAVPELAEVVPQPFEADEAAADHHQLFGLNVFPTASLFLDASGQPGGPVTDAVWHQFRRCGWSPDQQGESADHLGCEMTFLAFLTGAEADAWMDDEPAEAARMQSLQGRFLDRHLLWWLPALTTAVRQQSLPFFAALAGLTLDLVLEHRAVLAGGTSAAAPVPPLADPPPLLQRGETGLGDVAAFLTTPALSGLFLGREDVARLARHVEVPRGFGGRGQMLTNLLRSSATFGCLDALLERLLDQVQVWRASYRALCEGGGAQAGVVAGRWQERLTNTARMIERMRAEARSFRESQLHGQP